MRNPRRQRTIGEQVSCSGVGLHGGHAVQLTLHPEPPGRGVVFLRRRGGDRIEIPARAASVVSTDHATSLGCSEARIVTVEHLLAALYAMQIDNVGVEVDGDELPVLDGSAAAWVSLIDAAGACEQDAECDVLAVQDPLEIVDGLRRIRIEPAGTLRISYTIDFTHPTIGRQSLEIDALDRERFERDVAPARTFGFLDEVEALRRAGLARGGSLANTVVLDAEGVVNEDGLRFPDEFVRHKVLDLIGDLSLLGRPLLGHVSVERGGHALHQELVRALVSASDASEPG